jgi:hypothetical protein
VDWIAVGVGISFLALLWGIVVHVRNDLETRKKVHNLNKKLKKITPPMPPSRRKP